eukprot:TRINITY_DN298_c0_g1_i1.p1 TRINITY_DN298_c0_g1~~TRINITY_DN298_c0_g1_i1.p1  ORF type:complete len:267 (+),score=106.48 TRINITY_DN298_c0_g1_i1:49-801(+)
MATEQINEKDLLELRNLISTNSQIDQSQVDNVLLTRFLKSKKGNIQQANTAILNYFNWRNGFLSNLPVEDIRYEIEKRKAYFFFCDKNNVPTIIVHSGRHSPSSPDYNIERTLNFAIYIIINGLDLARMLVPNVQKFNLILDYTDFGLSHFDNPLTKRATDLLETYLQDSVGSIFLINYPWLLYGLWKIVSPWLDSETRERVKWCNLNELQAFFDADKLPRSFGGTNDWVATDSSVGLENYPNFNSVLKI